MRTRIFAALAAAGLLLGGCAVYADPYPPGVLIGPPAVVVAPRPVYRPWPHWYHHHHHHHRGGHGRWHQH
jgi:hypothetical protein